MLNQPLNAEFKTLNYKLGRKKELKIDKIQLPQVLTCGS